MNPTPDQPLAQAPYRDPDEINLLEYAYVLVKHKRLIIGLTLLGMALGLAAALIKGPVFVAEVLIAPKETESQKTPMLTSLGMLGGFVATQFGFVANPGLDRIETVLSTRKFGADLVVTHGLLPEMCRVFWPKLYRRTYDAAQKQWRGGTPPVRLSDVGGYLAEKVFKRQTARSGTKAMSLSVQSRDSAFSYALLSACVEHLNVYLRTAIIEDAGGNARYLDSILVTVADPLLREKIQSLIASEVEKMMVVSKEAFQVLDPVFVWRQYRHKWLWPVATGFVVLLAAAACVVLQHALGTAKMSGQDRKYIAAIRQGLRTA